MLSGRIPWDNAVFGETGYESHWSTDVWMLALRQFNTIRLIYSWDISSCRRLDCRSYSFEPSYYQDKWKHYSFLTMPYHAMKRVFSLNLWSMSINVYPGTIGSTETFSAHLAHAAVARHELWTSIIVISWQLLACPIRFTSLFVVVISLEIVVDD